MWGRGAGGAGPSAGERSRAHGPRLAVVATVPNNDAETPAAIAPKRLILCFDGTWNTPEDQTNVSRLYAAIADQHSGCERQLKFYDAGVGTSTGTRIRGGAFGLGIDDNILEGYSWLVNEYVSGAPTAEIDEATTAPFDGGSEIFIFGFSRGAFTARSLAGLINRCGVLKRDRLGDVGERARAGARLVREAWDLYRTDFGAGVEGRRHAACVKFRQENAWTPKITCLAVWDTVGALGIPGLSLMRKKYRFHDAGLGRVVSHAYHAMAIDEQREDYRVTLWEQLHPKGTRDVEQRWFPGAHGNVGGGYEDDLLPDVPLQWIARRAVELGLEFTDQFKQRLGELACRPVLPGDFALRGDEYLSPVRDSYAEFLRGIYRALRTVARRGRYYRPMLTAGVNETIDQTAHMKWAADTRYRPPNLAYAGRRDFDPSGSPGAASVTAQRSEAGTT